VAHAYTPGLRVTSRALLHRERRLPLKGEVLVRSGEAVEAATVVARTELPGNVHTVNLAAKLSVDPEVVPQTLLKALGARVETGEVIARAKSLFGLAQHKAAAPVAGTLESVSKVTGQLILREPPIPVQVDAYVRGRVASVLPEEGVIVETEAAFVQGIFGVGGETGGLLRVVAKGPDHALGPGDLDESCRGQVVVGGAYASHATVQRAIQLGAAALVVGGFDDRDLRALLGRDLGVAITGSEELGITLVLTEGFGHMRMADRTWKLLVEHQGREASVSGATQIRAGVMRPEIVVPLGDHSGPVREAGRESAGLELGSWLRVIREPYFGRIGRAVTLPHELRPLDTEAAVRVVEVEFAEDATRAWVPRANVELIES
jgi:hypothetical protein